MDASTRPVVSAIMPVYNMAHSVGAAIEGVLSQTYKEWELIVVDDGSTDETTSVVSSYSDPRIHLHRSEVNGGRGAARNRTLELARGQFIAVADGDDISLPERFERQVSYFRAHPAISVVSAQVRYFVDPAVARRIVDYPEDPMDIKARFERGVMGVSFAASMIRSDVFVTVGHFSEECLVAEDLELFLRAANHYQFANLADVLLLYRNDPLKATYANWLSWSLYHEYANYRHRTLQSAGTPVRFVDWRRRWTSWPRVIGWHSLRFLKHKFMVRSQWQRTP